MAYRKVFDFDSGISFYWNKSYSKICVDKGITNSAFQKDVAKIILRYSYDYTPYDLNKDYGATQEIGKLARYHMADMAYAKGYPTYGQIVYSKKYAKYQYQYPHEHTKPGTTDHWVEYAWNQHQDQILAEVEEARLKYVEK